MADQTVIPPYSQFTPEEFDRTVDIFRRNGVDPEAGLARMLANQLGEDYEDPNYISYETLRDGSAGVFELFPKTQEAFAARPPEQRGLTDRQIIEYFAYDMEGRPVQAGSVSEGMKRKALPGAAGAAAFLATAKATNALNQINPLTAVPVTLPQALYRIGSPLVTGTIAAIYASQAGDYLTEEMLGPAPLLTPGTEGRQVFGEVLMENAFFGLLPYGVSRNLSLSGLQSANAFTPIKLSRKALVVGDKAYKPTLGNRMTTGTEQMLKRMVDEAYDRPVPFLLVEGAATGVSATLAQGAEEAAPGQMLPRMSAEVTGGIIGGVGGDILIKRTSEIFTGVKNFISKAREIGVRGALEQRQTKNQREIANFLIDYIEKYGGDVDQIIANLTDEKTAQALQDYAVKTGKQVDLTAGVKSRSPLIFALEKQLELVTPGLASQRGIANREAVEAFRTALLAAHATGDPELVRVASQQMADLFELGLQTNLDARMLNLRNAVERLQTGGQGVAPERMSDLGDRIFDAVQDSLKLDRAKERYLWKNVPETITIKTFTGLDGNETNIPNFMKVWGDFIPDSAAPEAFEDTLRELASLVKFTERKRTELGLGGTVNTPAVPQNITKFRTMYGDLEGTDTQKMFDKMVEQFDLNTPTKESIEKLASLAQQSRGRKRAGSTLSKLYDAKRLALLAERDANPPTAFAETAAGIPKEVVADFNKFMENAANNDLLNKTIDVNDADALIKEAEEAEAFAQRQRSAELFDEADRFDQFAQMFRAKAQDLVEKPTVDPQMEGAVTIGELTSMRSKALSLAKQAGARGDSQTEALAFDFASAIERDIESFPEGEVLSYDIARNYSRALNDTYTRTFAGDILQTTKTGATRIHPEEVGRQLFSSNGGYLRAKQLDNVGKFQLTAALSEMLGEADGGKLLQSAKKAAFNEDTGFFDLNGLQKWVSENSEELAQLPGVHIREGAKGRLVATEGGNLLDNVNQIVASSLSLRGTTESVLRLIRTEAFDPEAPEKISAKTLRTWMEKSENKALLEAYPAIRMDLEDIVKGDNSKLVLFENEKRLTKEAMDAEKALLSVYSFLNPKGAESPATVISKFISPSADNPIRSLDTFWKRIEKAPASWTNEATGVKYTKKEAIEGFKSALLDAVFIGSGDQTGSTNARKAYMMMFAPNQKAQGKVSLMEWAKKNGVFDEGEIKDIEDFVGKMVEFEGTIFQGSAADVSGLMAKMGPSAELVVSVLGSSAGTRLQNLIAPDSGTATIIAAGRGAEAFRKGYSNVFKNIPNAFRMDLLKEIIKDPEALARTLRLGKTEKEQNRYVQYMTRWLVDKGFMSPARRALPGLATPDEEPANVPPAQPEVVAPPVGPVSSIAPTAMPAPRPPVPAQPVAQPTTTLASAPPPPAPSGPVDRARFAAMFPEDADLVRGIGSLRT